MSDNANKDLIPNAPQGEFDQNSTIRKFRIVQYLCRQNERPKPDLQVVQRQVSNAIEQYSNKTDCFCASHYDCREYSTLIIASTRYKMIIFNIKVKYKERQGFNHE